MKYLVLILIALPLFMFSCNNDDDSTNPEPEKTSDLVLNFEFKVGSQPLELGTGEYIFANEDTVGIDKFKFILSNLTLNKVDQSQWKNEDGYYLVKASNGSSNYQLTLENVPIGDYSSMEFHIGMDSAMNFKPESFPILFQQEGMYWDWNTGYKFLVMEGRYISTSLSTPNNTIGFITHIGDMINLNILSFQFSQDLTITTGETRGLNFEIDLGKMYTNPNRLSFKEVNNRNIMGGPNAGLVSENYAEGMIDLINLE